MKYGADDPLPPEQGYRIWMKRDVDDPLPLEGRG
jgi:hypothetical protein